MPVIKVKWDTKDVYQFEIPGEGDCFVVGRKSSILSAFRRNKQMGLEELLPTQQALKEKVLNEVKEFNAVSDGSREQKRNIMEKRKLEIMNKEKDFLKDVYRRLLGRFFSLEKVDFFNLRPRLVLCESQEEKDIWRFFRITQSSLPFTGHRGRMMTYLLTDSTSNCAMGILGLTSDLPTTVPRDRFIDWTRREKFDLKRIDNLMNISTCVSLPPFNLLLVGKLLAMLSFSDQVLNDFKKRYEQPLVGITTSSLFGESIQYDRLSGFLKYLGLSKGMGNVQFSQSLIEEMRKHFNGLSKRMNRLDWEPIGNSTLPKSKMIRLVAMDLGLNPEKILKHQHRRGIYFGYTCQNSREFLCGRIEEKELVPIPHRSFGKILEHWRQRWFVKRVDRISEIEKDRRSYVDGYNVVLNFDRGQKTLNDLSGRVLTEKGSEMYGNGGKTVRKS